jgi:hypothetical protein
MKPRRLGKADLLVLQYGETRNPYKSRDSSRGIVAIATLKLVFQKQRLQTLVFIERTTRLSIFRRLEE